MTTSESSPEPSLSPVTSSAEASRARISAKPESEPDSQTLTARRLAAAFGLNSPASLGYFDPDGCSLRTSQACLFQEQSEEYLETFPDSGMWDAGSVYELQTSGPATCESGSLSWHTPSTEDHKSDGPLALGRYGTPDMKTSDQRLRNQAMTWPTARQEDGESCGNHPGVVDSLTGAVKLWPTANAHDATGARGKGFELTDHHYETHDLASATDTWRTPDTPGQGGPRNRQGSIGAGHQVTIAEQAEHWLTPHGMANEDKSGKKGGAGGGEFALQANNWPTPNSNPSGPNNSTTRENSRIAQRLTDQCLESRAQDFPSSPPAPQTPDGPQSSETATSRRRLNPRFVEWLMGFTPGYTEMP